MTAGQLLIINPNTNHAITATLCAAAARHAPPGQQIIGRTATFGFPVIATRASFAIAAHAALDAYAAHDGPADAVILGCFGDPGLQALREIAPVPVIGLAEASFAAAAGSFAVLTAGVAWRPMLLEQIALSPHAARCRGVWTLEATGADVARDPERFVEELNTLAECGVAAGATSIILGGAVLAGYAPRLRPVAHFVDCVHAAVEQLPCLSVSSPAVQPGAPSALSPHLSARLRP